MKSKLKKLTAILILIVLALGWVGMIKGIGPIKPLKDTMQLGLDIKGGAYVVMEAQDVDKYSAEELRDLMEQTQAVITRRVDAMGIANPNVTIEGNKRIRVEMPGVEDADEALDQIGKTAQLKFTLADQQFVMDGSNIKDAGMGTDQEKGGYVVNLKFDSQGAEAFENATAKASSGKVTSTYPQESNVADNAIVILLDDEIISAPTCEKTIVGDGCEITGNFSKEEATNLAALIRGGSLPVEMKEITSSVQTAQIGLNALDNSVKAGIIGFALVLLIMLFGYRLMGLAADIALGLYVMIVLMVMAYFGSVLTLSGIAGIILAVGMAVDSNVIIFSRIKEEIASGKSVRSAVQSGFRRALGTVIDAQVTTLIAAVILYQIGTSSVKGFAFTLMLGILVSIFTAVVVTQLYLSIFADSEKLSKMSLFGMNEDGTRKQLIKKQFSFIKHRKKFYAVSLAIIIVGVGFFAFKGFNTGIDFTGGTMFQIDLGKHVDQDTVKDALEKQGIDKADVVYSGDGNREVIIKTTKALDNKARQDVITGLQKEFKFEDEDVLATELFGPSVGKELTNNAIKAVLLAALGMLIYIRLRFKKWKFGAAAIAGVIHDALILMTFYLVFRVTVNNPFIAAVLTVVGYSINDTIVVFDRIRENNKYMRKGGLEQIIDTSVNQTLSRSIMTSVTTIVVMVPLLLMGGTALRDFTLPLMVGVLAGTMSSIFLCSPFYFELATFRRGSQYQRQVAKAQKAQKKQAEKAFDSEVDDPDALAKAEAKAAKEADLDDVSRQAEQMVGGEGADELIIPKANTTAKKTDMYKGKKKQSRKSRKQNK